MADKRLDQTTNASAVAAADNIPFVTAAGVTSYVTGDEMAASGPFSSRYKPLASDTIWIPAPQFIAATGSPTLTALYAGAGWQVDADVVEQLQTNLYFPPSWNTFSVDVWWSNVVGGGSGNVRLRVYWVFQADGDAYDSGLVSPTGVTVTAAAAKIIKKTQLQASQALTVGNMADFTVFRDVTNVDDTLANDINIHGVLLTRVT